MALENTMQQLSHILGQLQKDLIKSARGNKAASQRVRTNTIRLEKIGKKYRKESIQAEKSGRSGRAKKKVAKKTTRKSLRKKTATGNTPRSRKRVGL